MSQESDQEVLIKALNLKDSDNFDVKQNCCPNKKLAVGAVMTVLLCVIGVTVIISMILNEKFDL